MKSIGWVLVLWCASLAAVPVPAAAQITAWVAEKNVTRGEFALLPEWCIDSQEGPYGSPEGGEGLNKSPRARQWVGVMGTDFWHMHHYCRGLRDLLRLDRAGLTPRDREYLQTRAVNEFSYILNNCQPTMPLMPEVLLKKGEVHVIQGDLVSAIDAFELATKLKPDYWPAYDRWVDLLIRLKQLERARTVVEQGLAALPDQPNLMARRNAIQAGARAPHKPARVSAAASAP